jgi:arylformamidase
MRTIITFLLLASSAQAAEMKVHRDLAYDPSGNKRQTLDVYAPALGAKHPIMVWIHGGGWQKGDKTDVDHKPQAFVDRGFVFVSTNYRLFPEVTIRPMAEDIAKAIRWIHEHAIDYDGDPSAIFVLGHSAGAQLAALVSTDQRYLKAEGLSLKIIRGCIPVDGGAYDVPMRTANADLRTADLFRQKFGEEQSQKDLSAVTHIAKGQDIPPFLLLCVADTPRTREQAERLAKVLKESAVSAQVFAAENKNHRSINAELGSPDDPPTKALYDFLSAQLKK